MKYTFNQFLLRWLKEYVYKIHTSTEYNSKKIDDKTNQIRKRKKKKNSNCTFEFLR